ncbi:TIGR04255 family protein [Oscillatoria acuminata]|uniref:TIGR04255 family protein n=1 Tax=Oscillatoria acuminata PCC 6304 TaxID=56110 RepID=K9THT0_9CYAN|nr:TIGR04255 family protein [Oscillatoria acuminata]AFY81953.1 hypothetical protein Oscil6304_2324 [Oscillatoria acuminata PCC 6304]
MQKTRHYSRSPITQAVIDLQIELSNDVTVEHLSDLHLQVQADYPQCQNLLVFQGQIMGVTKVEETASQSLMGYGFFSRDRKQIVQARRDGFSFTRLAPYERWENFRDEAQRLWRIYRSLTTPNRLTRLSLRYINRLDLPLPFEDFKEYLRTVPEVSFDLPQALSGYFLQLQIPYPELTGILVLNQAIIPPPKAEVVSVLVDIDLVREEDIPNDEIQLWELIEQYHAQSIQIFESCITDRSRELMI